MTGGVRARLSPRRRVAEAWAGTPELTAMLAALPELPEGGHTLGESPRSVVRRLPLGEHSVVVKRYRTPGRLQALARGLRRSKAERCWRAAGILEALGIPAMRRIAWFELRWGPWRQDPVFVGTWVPGEDLRAHLLDPEIDDASRTARAGAVVALVDRLHQTGYVHGDLKWRNIRFGTDGVPTLVDLDDVHRPPPGPRRTYMLRRDWRILLHNWRDDAEMAELFRTQIERYLGPAAFSRVLARPFRR